jgi:hypothetical protein
MRLAIFVFSWETAQTNSLVRASLDVFVATRANSHHRRGGFVSPFTVLIECFCHSDFLALVSAKF